MKLTLTTLVVWLCLCTATMANTLIVISPFQDSGSVNRQIAASMELIFELNQGETLTYINGETAETIAVLSVPEDKRLADNPNSRLNHNAGQIALLGQFATQAHADSRISGALNLPLVLKEIARYHRHADDILVVGSAIFDLAGVSQDVTDGDKILLDENIQQSSEASLFGTTNMPELLKGFRLHWWVTSNYAERVTREATERFWHLWLHHQSAQLISYTSDQNAVFQQLNNGAEPLPMPYTLRVTAAKATVQLKGENTHLFQRPLSMLTLPRNIWLEPQLLTLGISWQAPVDMDIYASVNTGQKPVYFGNPKAHNATFLKDIFSGSTGKATRFETIEFHRPVNLCRLIIGINHYRGKQPQGVNGLLRIEVRDQTYQVPFTTTAMSGNKGKDMLTAIISSNASAHSLLFSVADVVGNSGCHA